MERLEKERNRVPCLLFHLAIPSGTRIHVKPALPLPEERTQLLMYTTGRNHIYLLYHKETLFNDSKNHKSLMCLLNLSEGSSFGDMGCQDSSYAIAQI